MTPRVIEFKRNDYNNFDKMKADGLYKFAGLTVNNSTLRNSECFAKFFNTSFMYADFGLKFNRPFEGRKVSDKPALYCFDYARTTNITLSRWNALGNDLGDSTLLRFDLKESEEDKGTGWPQHSTIQLSHNSTFKDNKSKRRAALFELIDLPWMWFRVEHGAVLDNNFGTIVNDVYVQNIRRMDYFKAHWR